MKRFCVMAVVTAVIAVMGFSVSAMASGHHGKPSVFAPHSHPYGSSYRAWAADWFSWVAETPTPQNPFVDPDNCGPFNSHKVWFLGASTGGFVQAHCTIPQGKALLISPAGDFCSGGTDNLFTSSELRACARGKTSELEGVRVTIDGCKVPHIGRFYLVTRKFSVDLPLDNIFGLPEGSAPAAVGGVFVIIKPLSVGHHTIVGHISSPIDATIKYHITVKAH